MSPVPSFSTRRWERKSSSRARSCTFMTLVERHFVLADLCRWWGEDEIAIKDGIGGREIWEGEGMGDKEKGERGDRDHS